MKGYELCRETVDLLSTETCVGLARRWQERHGYPKSTLENMVAQALWEIVLGRHVRESILEEVEEALESVRVARAMRRD